MLSSCVWEEHWGVEEVAAALPSTEAAGPESRIKSRSRSTSARDLMAPVVVKTLTTPTSVT